MKVEISANTCYRTCVPNVGNVSESRKLAGGEKKHPTCKKICRRKDESHLNAKICVFFFPPSHLSIMAIVGAGQVLLY